MKDLNKIKKSKEKREKEQPKSTNLFVTVVVSLIIVTFIFWGSSLLGFRQVINDIFFKEVIKNPDGTVTIPSEAQVEENRRNEDTYIGKVLGEKIRMGRDDEFNRKLMQLMYESQQRSYNMDMVNLYRNEAKKAFNEAINKVIGMHIAQKLDIKITRNNNYYIQELGRKYYSDNNGNIDYDKMKKDKTEAALKGKELIKDLLYEDFNKDYFYNLPVTNDELWDFYRLDEAKVSVNFIAVSSYEIDNQSLKKFFEDNKEKFKKYKLTKLYFKNKDIALKSFDEIKKNLSKFTEIARRLKSEDTASMEVDADYSFAGDFEDTKLKESVKNAKKNNIGSEILETKLGFLIYYVDDELYADINNKQDLSKIKSDYMKENKDLIDKSKKERAEEIYKTAVEKGFEHASIVSGLEIQNSISPIRFLEKNFYNNPELTLDFDNTDDLNFTISLFKSKKGDIIKPKKYTDGYIVAKIKDKTIASKETFTGLIDSLRERYISRKSDSVKKDFYDNERKKFRIVDNFDLCIKYEWFLPKKEDQQQ